MCLIKHYDMKVYRGVEVFYSLGTRWRSVVRFVPGNSTGPHSIRGWGWVGGGVADSSVPRIV